MRAALCIFIGIILSAGSAAAVVPDKKIEDNKPSNIFNTMMLEQVEEATEEFNQVEVINKKVKEGDADDKGKKKPAEKEQEPGSEKPVTE